MTQTNLDAYALKNGYSKLINEMSQAEQVQLRYAYVTDALSLAAGDFVKTQDSWANQTRILSEQWKQLMSILGSGLMQVLTPALQALNRFLSYVIQWANALGKIFSSLFGTAATEFTSAAGNISAGISSAAEAEENLADAAAAANKELRQQMGFDEMNILAPAGSSGGSTGSTGGMGELITAADPAEKAAESTADRVQQKLESLLEWFKQTFKPAISAWGNAFTAIAPAAEESGGRIRAAWNTLWTESLAPFGGYVTNTFVPGIVNSFSETMAPILAETIPAALDMMAESFEKNCEYSALAVERLTLALQECQQMFEDMMQSISTNWETYGGGLLAGFQEFQDGVYLLWDYIYSRIIDPVVTNIGSKFAWLWDTSLKPLWDNLVEFGLSVADNLLYLWNSCLAPALMWLVHVFGPAVSTVINTVVDVFFVLVAVVADVIGGILKALDGLIQFVVGVFTGNWERAWEGIAKFFGGIWDAIWGIIRGVINLVISAINLLIGAIYSVLAAIVNGIGGVAKAVGKLVGKNWGFSMPSVTPRIPLLAQGAVLPANKPFLAMVGDQKNGTNIEAPLETIKQALVEVLQDTGGGSDRPVQIVIKVGSDTLGVAAIKSINQLTRQTGRLELQLS